MPRPPERPSHEALLHKLKPETIRANLVRAGLLLAGWEMLKGEVQDQVRDFFVIDDRADPAGALRAEYKKPVLVRHESVFEASLLWLVEAEALTEPQAACVRSLRAYRNEVAHELPTMLLEPGRDVDVTRIRQMQDIVAALGRFWGRITVDTDPQFDGQDIADAGIQSGIMMLMNILITAAERAESA